MKRDWTYHDKMMLRQRRQELAESMPRIKREAWIAFSGSAIIVMSVIIARRLGRFDIKHPSDILLMVLILAVIGCVSMRHALSALAVQPLREPLDRDALTVLIAAGAGVLIPWLYALVLLGWLVFGLR